MLKIGCFISSSKGYLEMGKVAASINANTFQFFTRNPRGGAAKDINPEDIAAFLDFARDNGISCIVAHAPYTLNACSADAGLREFARNTMADDLARMEYTPGNFYNFHPGSHVRQGAEIGIKYIAELLNAVITPKQSTAVLLETMAGKGSEIGADFHELREIIDRTEHREKLGVCLDTCHVWDAGFDIVNNLDGVLTEFDKIIGLDRLKAIHLNDSLNVCGAKKDRHAKLGEGYIGKEALVRVINHPALRELPFNLETPNDIAGYAEEIGFLRSQSSEAQAMHE